MRATIDTARCQGKARCFNLYPRIFARGADGKGVVLYTGDLDTDELIVDAQSAANACPRGAIRIED
jgi:ferredoxin